MAFLSECPPGYRGTNCTFMCYPPYYGAGCRQLCQCRIDMCDVVSGCKMPRSTGRPNRIAFSFDKTDYISVRGPSFDDYNTCMLCMYALIWNRKAATNDVIV